MQRIIFGAASTHAGAWLHPYLGIGGAERLVVDAALQLQAAGHRVTIFSTHPDPAHCFAETRNGQLDVRVYGDFLPVHVGQRLRAPCTIVRMAFLACALAIQALARLRERIPVGVRADAVDCGRRLR